MNKKNEEKNIEITFDDGQVKYAKNLEEVENIVMRMFNNSFPHIVFPKRIVNKSTGKEYTVHWEVDILEK